MPKAKPGFAGSVSFNEEVDRDEVGNRRIVGCVYAKVDGVSRVAAYYRVVWNRYDNHTQPVVVVVPAMTILDDWKLIVRKGLKKAHLGGFPVQEWV